MFLVEFNVVSNFTRMQGILMVYQIVNNLIMEVQGFVSFVEIADIVGYKCRLMSFTLFAVRH
jgi:hypothetical protein